MWFRSVAVICMLFGVAAGWSARAGEPTFTPQSVLDGKVEILVPQDFELMSDEMARLKYPSERRPPIAFTNYDGAVNISVKPTDHRMSETEVAATRMSLVRSFRSLYPSGTVRSGNVDLNGRAAFLIDMHTPAVDTVIYNLIAGAPVEDRLVMFSFNVTRELESEWADIGKYILMTIKITD